MGTTAQKLEYLGTTKSQLKDMINYGLDDNNKITSSTTFRNYVSSIFNAFLEALRTPDTLFTNLPKKSGTGANITLNGTANAPMRIELNASELTQAGTPTPNSPQDIHTISGSNKVVVENSNILDLSTLVKGYYITGANPTITGATDERFRSFSKYLKAGTYTINFNKNANATRAFTSYDYSSDNALSNFYNATSGTFTMTQDGIAYISFRKNDNTNWNDNEDLVWLNKGSTALPYEPYISQEADIDLTGKNIFDGSVGGSAGEYLTSTGSVSSGGSNLRYSNYIKLNEGQTSLYVSGMQDTMGTPAICFYNSSKTFISGVAYDSAIEKAITIPTNAVYFRTSYRTNNLYFMIEYGNKKTNYEPYLGIEYCKIGNYEDKFIRTSGKNKLDLTDLSYLKSINTAGTWTGNTYTINGMTYTINDGGTIKVNGTSTGNAGLSLYGTSANQKSINGKYILLGTTTTSIILRVLNYTNGYNTLGTNSSSTTPTQLDLSTYNTGYIELMIYSGQTINNVFLTPMLTDTSITDYEPYGTNEWYIKKNIGKVVLDGTESWSDFSAGNTNFRCQYDVALPNILTPPSNPAVLYSNYFKAINRDNAYATTEVGIAQYGSTLGKIFISAPNTILSELTSTGWKNWLSTHNLEVYYLYATPTYTPITGTLAEQFEYIREKMLSQKGQTNISQVNNDLAFGLSASALEDIG